MLRITGTNFHAVATAAKGADKAIIREMRRGVRLAGEGVVGDIRDEIDRIPSSGRYGTGVRAALKAGTRTSISVASARSAGVRIVTDPRRLPPGRRALAKAMNLQRFRHPVRPDPAKPRTQWTWVEQEGRPYFGGVILRHRRDMESDIWRALKQAEYQVQSRVSAAAK